MSAGEQEGRSSLGAFRDHCRKMAATEHVRECRGVVQDRWGVKLVYPDPKCKGCISPGDRALFARLADEIDEYQAGDDEDEGLFG